MFSSTVVIGKSKGFVPVKAKPEKPADKSAKLTPISQIQADLSSYFNDIKDSRVNRTKKHLLKGHLEKFKIYSLGQPLRQVFLKS